MKLLHFADLHIGMENYGRLDPETGLHSRLKDFIATFNFIVDYAIREHIDLVVFAGDAYKTREPTPTHENAFASGIKRLSNAGIPVVLVVGNHDLPNTRGKSDTLTIYDALDIPHVYVSSNAELKKIQTARGETVQIITLPWATKSHLLAKEDFSGKNIEEINEALTRKLVSIIEGFTSRLDPALPTVFASHITVSGSKYGSEQNVMLGSDVVIPLGALANPKFDYVALGHLHKHQVLSEDPPVIYAGSPDRVDFGEEREEKGFVVADILPGVKTSYQFIETPVRPFLTITVNITESDTDPTGTIITAIKKHTLKEKVVRLQIDVPEETNKLINDKSIREELSSAHFFAGTQKNVHMKTRSRSSAHSISTDLAPMEALQKFIVSKQIDPLQARELTKRANDIIQELRESEKA